jgi:hypothetical protein
MPEEMDCLKATIYLFLHVAKSGCCEVCLWLDGWYTAEEEPEPPYEILQHDFCRCHWVMFTIDGLWRETREELMNNHVALRQQYYDALVEIAGWDDKIAERELQLGSEREEKAVPMRNAEEYNNRSIEAQDRADEILNNNEELTPEQQEQVDEYLFQAEDFLQKAEDCLMLADEIQQDIFESERNISSSNDERDAEIYRRDEATTKLNEVEPCLSLGCIEDKATEIAGSRLIMEF